MRNTNVPAADDHNPHARLELNLVPTAAWSSLHVVGNRITLDGLRLGVPFNLAV